MFEFPTKLKALHLLSVFKQGVVALAVRESNYSYYKIRKSIGRGRRRSVVILDYRLIRLYILYAYAVKDSQGHPLGSGRLSSAPERNNIFLSFYAQMHASKTLIFNANISESKKPSKK
ncbi:hypothetical protein GQX74_010206 [Glossina fuscipes]|nr:hypothetical protein GQX74_010206 [Glossina fuscipes]